MTPNGTSRLKAASVVFGVLLVAVTIGYLYVFRTGGDVRFKDRGLENAVLEAVSNEHDDARQNSLFREDLERITRLDASGCGIETIEGIERLSNLQVLDLSGNPLSSIEPLAELPKLVELSLRNTGISDIQPLAHLVRLQVLDLRETDLSESGLEPLQDLNALEELNLRETGVRDVTVLAELQNLRYLNIHSNDAVSSLEPITGLTRLRTLIMRNVPVHDQIHVLKDLHNLRRLNIRNTGVSDLRVLASLMSRGALQDGPSGTVMADVDIRDNPVEASVDEGPFGYDVLLPYWENISQRKPEKLPRTPTREVLINEAVTSNGTVVTDADGDYPDWIELFNPGERPVDIGGFFLSDNPDETDPWEIPQGTIIGPGEYLMVWASGKDSDGSVDELHSSFALSADGTTIVLSRPGAGARIDIVEVPPIPRDTSFGRNTQGEFVHFIDPTPGDSNEGAREYLSVSFSHNGGFYDKPFELILTCPDDSADIYYTFNGSVPDPVENSEHTYLYDGPISINEDGPVPERRPEQTADIPTTIPKAEFWEWQPPEGELSTGTVVRAIAYKNRPRSNVYSESYFIDSEIRNVFPLAAVSIIADPDNLFSHEKGIYVPGRVYEENVDYEGRWMQHPANYYERWEVPAHIEFFEPDGFRGFAVDGGIRIHGSWSRSHPLKSLRLYARKDYDRRNYFSYPVFPEACRRNGHDTISRYKRLLLRSGQSLFGSFLQDGVSHAHIHPYVEVDLLRFRPVVHFINGEYWGLKNLRERFDRFYLEANYGIDPENAVILGGPLGFEPSLEHGRPEDRRDFHDLQNYIFNNNMADDKLYQSVTEQMDIDSFIDYNVVRIYSGDTDGVTKHVAMWRLRDGNEGAGISGVDGRWRFHTWDLDNALRIVDNDSMTFYANDRAPEEHRRIQAEKQRNQEEDELTEVDSSKIMNVYHPQYTRLFVDLLQNRMFRRKFLNRFADLLNSVYRPEVYSETIEKAAAIIEPEIRRHIRRWGYPLSFRYWRSQVELNLEFARRRPDIQRRHIIEYFVQRYDEPSSTASVTIGPLGPGGTVRINSLTINGDLPGTA
ncbi:MAG: CotH kinase family protein, partial [Spirochaetia bacterium]